MAVYLCNRCGKKLDSSMRTCPDCGAINPNNEEIIEEVSTQIKNRQKAVRRFSIGFSIVSLVIGIILCIIHIALIISEPPLYLSFEVFIGAVSGGAVAVFSVIGLSKKEGVEKAIFIAGGISLWMLLMYLFLSF